MLDVLASIGTESIRLLWVPLLTWTVLWVLAEAALWLLRDAHPGIRYRLTQAVLWVLPLSIALAIWMPTDWLPSSWALASWAPIPDAAPAGGAVWVQPLTDAVGLATPVSPSGPNLVLVGLGLGACGLVAMALASLVRLGAQSLAVLQLRRAIPRVDDPAFESTAHRIASSLGVERTADVVLTPADVVPMTLGIRRPLVVIPDTLPLDDRRAALLHELVHVREQDPLAQAAEALVAALFYAHPAVHRLARRCDLLREMACDAAVLAHTNVSRRSYAALVSSFATPSTARALPATVGMASPVVHIHQRLRAMSMSRPLPSRLATWLPAFAILLIATGLVTAGSALAQTPIEEVIVEEPAGTLRLITEDSVRVHALKAEIEALSAQQNRLVQEVEIGESAGHVGVIREQAEASKVQVGVLREQLEALRASEHQLDRALQGELEVISESRFTRQKADLDSVIAVGQLLRMSETESRLQALKEQLSTLSARASASFEANGTEQVEKEIPLDGIESTALRLGSVYPNPAQDEVIIDVSVSEPSDVSIGLYDLTGRRMVTREVRLEAGAHKVTLDTRELAAGTYVSRVSAKSESGTARSTNRVTIVR